MGGLGVIKCGVSVKGGDLGREELELWVKCKVERRARVLVSRLRNPTSF